MSANANTDSPGAVVDRVMSDLCEYIRRETGQPPELDMHLVDSGVLDSMAMVLFVAHVEQQFNIDMDADDLARGVLATVRSAARHIAARIAAESR